MAERKGRTTVYNAGLTTNYDTEVSKENRNLIAEFIDYLKSVDKSPQTIKQYEQQLKIWACWNAKENGNVFFVDMKKRQFVKFFSYLQNTLGSSSNRVSSLRAVLSSMSNYIERIMDEEYPTFRNIVKVLEPVTKTVVREKMIVEEAQVTECLEKLAAKGKYQVACALAVLASSGMRKAELIQMKPAFFVKENEIFNGLAYETEKIRTKGRTRAGKVISRIVFKKPFQKYYDLWMEERSKLGIDSEWLFVTQKDGKYVQAEIATANSFAGTIQRFLGEPFYKEICR